MISSPVSIGVDEVVQAGGICPIGVHELVDRVVLEPDVHDPGRGADRRRREGHESRIRELAAIGGRGDVGQVVCGAAAQARARDIVLAPRGSDLSKPSKR